MQLIADHGIASKYQTANIVVMKVLCNNRAICWL